MACSQSSSTSSLYDEEALRATLQEKENIIQTAAQYGKDLLDQNRELTQSLDETNRKYTRQLEVLKEENYSLTQKLDQKERMEEEYQDEIDSLKKHLASQRDELKVLNELTDQSILLSDLRKRLRELEAVSDQSELENKQLKTQILSNKHQIEEANNKIKTLQESLNDTASDEMSVLLKEFSEVTEAKEELSRDYALLEKELHKSLQLIDSQSNQFSSLQEELDSANSQLSSLSNSFMVATQENQELRCEIDMLRMNDRDHKKKGNSMFSELDDKRQEAEKKLLLLNVQYEGIVNQYDLGKKQMAKLKVQMSNILRMTGGQVDSNHVAELENQVSEARNEIRLLTTKLEKLTPTESSKIPQAMKDSHAVEGDRRMIDFVENLLEARDEELKTAKKELQEKRLSAMYSTQQLNDVQCKLRSVESKANKLHAQNIQLSVKLEEIKTKYKVESNSQTCLERGTVENIPDYDPELAQALLLGANAATTHSHEPDPIKQESIDEEVSTQEPWDTSSVQSDNARSADQSTCSVDNRSLSEMQNKLETSPLRRRTPGQYFTKCAGRSPMSSTDSLWGGDQANVKSYDNPQSCVGERKVINVKGGAQDPNNCPTQ